MLFVNVLEFFLILWVCLMGMEVNAALGVFVRQLIQLVDAPAHATAR